MLACACPGRRWWAILVLVVNLWAFLQNKYPSCEIVRILFGDNFKLPTKTMQEQATTYDTLFVTTSLIPTTINSLACDSGRWFHLPKPYPQGRAPHISFFIATATIKHAAIGLSTEILPANNPSFNNIHIHLRY
jgi:hypothetical protein